MDDNRKTFVFISMFGDWLSCIVLHVIFNFINNRYYVCLLQYVMYIIMKNKQTDNTFCLNNKLFQNQTQIIF